MFFICYGARNNSKTGGVGSSKSYESARLLSRTHLTGKNIAQVLFYKLLAFFQSVLPADSRRAPTHFAPLDDRKFEELCAEVYYELTRREKNALHREAWEVTPWDDLVSEESEAFQALAWLPTNLFNGLTRDIYFEIHRRYPDLLLPTKASPPTVQPEFLCDGGCKVVHELEVSPEGVGSMRASKRPQQAPLLASSINKSPVLPNDARIQPFSIGDPPLDVSDSLGYLDAIMSKFQNNPDVYNNFWRLVGDFKSQRMDARKVIQRVGTLLTGHSALLEGLNIFMPFEHRGEHLGETEDDHTYSGESSDVASGCPPKPSSMPSAPTNIAPTSVYLPAQPFSKQSPLCLDGQIVRQSTHVVASGGYADIWTGLLATNRVAIKTMRAFSSMGTPIQRNKLLKRLWREYLTWSRLSHPNILDCLGFSYDFTPQSEYEVPSLISPWMSNGTVLSYIDAHPSVDRFQLIVGIAEGLSYLHNREPAIVHGDLRAANILVSDAGRPCLTDFGLSRILSDTRGMTSSSEPAGSVRWMSPELLHNDKASESSDVWAYGMTVLEIMSGKRPYHQFNLEPVVLRQIIDGQVPSRPLHVSALADELWNLCKRCWCLQPIERPSMHEVTLTLGGTSNMTPS